jgi:hypothetical protein
MLLSIPIQVELAKLINGTQAERMKKVRLFQFMYLGIVSTDHKGVLRPTHEFKLLLNVSLLAYINSINH